MSENSKETPPTRKQLVGQWMCVIGAFMLVFSTFSVNVRVTICFSAIGLVYVCVGLYLTRTPKSSGWTRPTMHHVRIRGPEDDPVFMSQLANRLDQLRRLPPDPFL